jgi:type III pantothenate kinase
MPEQLTLAVDVGNSRIKFGVFARPDLTTEKHTLPEGLMSLAVSAAEPIDWRAVVEHFEPWVGNVDQAVIAGANPAGVQKVLDGWPNDLGPEPAVIESPAKLPLAVRVEHPEKVGIDRLLNAVAVNVLHRGPAIIVDSGTATTVDFISADGAFEGGAILSGLALGALALHRYTALLPLVDVLEFREKPPPTIGRNTIDAMKSGLWFGQVGAIKEIVSRYGSLTQQPAELFLTGGFGQWLAPELSLPNRYEPDLALRGLAWLLQTAIATRQ